MCPPPWPPTAQAFPRRSDAKNFSARSHAAPAILLALSAFFLGPRPLMSLFCALPHLKARDILYDRPHARTVTLLAQIHSGCELVSGHGGRYKEPLALFSRQPGTGPSAGHALKEWQRKLDETRKESGELAVVPFVYQKSHQAGAGPGYKKFSFPPLSAV